MGFKPAPDIEEIANAIIDEHYAEYREMDITFRYVFTEKESKNKGKSVVGNARLLTGIAAYLALYPDGTAPVGFADDDDTRLFLLTFHEDSWKKIKTHHQRKACVHRHLMRCEAYEETDEKDQTKIIMRIKAFGIEAFPEEFELYGAWEEDMQEVADALKSGPQMSLFEIEKLPGEAPPPAGGDVETGVIRPDEAPPAETGTSTRRPGPKIPFETAGDGLTGNKGSASG